MGKFSGARKFKARWTKDVRGVNHPSDGEAKYYNRLYGREDRGEIRIVEMHPTWAIKIALNCPHCAAHGEHLTNIEMDARIAEGGVERIEDYKGEEGNTPLSKLKRKLLLLAHGVDTQLVGPALAAENKKKEIAALKRAAAKSARGRKKRAAAA